MLEIMKKQNKYPPEVEDMLPFLNLQALFSRGVTPRFTPRRRRKIAR
jgi:hypothetical protein